ncbi:unnamed protein product [Caenorhabditis brenneri]
MSSLALVPFTFPVLKLPLVALQNVADDLNPHEIYNFSRISKRTKNLAKVLQYSLTGMKNGCPIIDSYEKHFTNQDLNTFIKNWQLGLGNSNWKSVCIKISEPIKLQDVLKDITVTYRDPRTVKRHISVGYESYWIFGGIDIQKHDGTATATIQWKKYRVNSEDSEVPIKLIREYERNIGVVLNEEDELEDDQHDEVQHEEFQLEEEQLEEDELVEDQLEDEEHEEHELQAADLHANFMLWLKRFSQAEFSMYIW